MSKMTDDGCCSSRIIFRRALSFAFQAYELSGRVSLLQDLVLRTDSQKLPVSAWKMMRILREDLENSSSVSVVVKHLLALWRVIEPVQMSRVRELCYDQVPRLRDSVLVFVVGERGCGKSATLSLLENTLFGEGSKAQLMGHHNLKHVVDKGQKKSLATPITFKVFGEGLAFCEYSFGKESDREIEFVNQILLTRLETLC